MRKIVPGNFRRRRESWWRMSCARRDAAHNRIEVAGILTDDGRGCGSRKNFQLLLGSRENWVAKN